MTKKILTKGQVDRLGDKIREQQKAISEETLINLQEYRTSHKEALSQVFNTLCKTTKQITGDSIVTYRIKRFESIIGKLSRYPDMKFSRMWDIGGCRCILRNDKEVYRLKELIEQELTVRKIYDYIQSPQSEGYKSLHLFVCVPDDDKVIEVQLRNQNDHNWATLVEITDLLFDAKLKEYGQNKELLRFHYLLSKKNDLSLFEKREIADITEKYDYFNKISGVFSRNYLQVRKQWLDIEDKPSHKFFLLETNKDEAPKIESFTKFNDAETFYFNVYKASDKANIVLTHLPSPSYRHISMAYSNYILTVHSFQDDLFTIIEGLIVDSLVASNYRLFLRYFNHYNNTVITHVQNLFNEIISVSEYSKKSSKKHKSRRKKKEREWNRDIGKQISNRGYQFKRIQKEISNNWPKSTFRRFIVTQIMQVSSHFHARKLKKLIEKTEGMLKGTTI
jgi:putative GTP pyrophosphokinase